MTERIRLDESDLKHLLLGGEIQTPDGNKIILADVGYAQISNIVFQLPQLTPRLGEVRKPN